MVLKLLCKCEVHSPTLFFINQLLACPLAHPYPSLDFRQLLDTTPRYNFILILQLETTAWYSSFLQELPCPTLSIRMNRFIPCFTLCLCKCLVCLCKGREGNQALKGRVEAIIYLLSKNPETELLPLVPLNYLRVNWLTWSWWSTSCFCWLENGAWWFPCLKIRTCSIT